MQSITLRSAGIFDFIISLVTTFIILIDTLKMEKNHIGEKKYWSLTRQDIDKHNLSEGKPGSLGFKDGNPKFGFGGTLSLKIDIRANQAH